MGYGAQGVWVTWTMAHMGNEVQRVWGTWSMGYRGMGHMGNGVQGYGAHVWAMRYRGMEHIGNGVQGAGVWGTCMGKEV